MLSVEELQARTYEERMEDVLKELPLRSAEWTNYNPSDPGITVTENLTAFAAIQGSDIVSMSYRARMALLKMAGFIPGRGKCSRLLLCSDELSYPRVFYPGQRFHLGDICFETNRETYAGGARLTGVFVKEAAKKKEDSEEAVTEAQIPADNDSPVSGDANDSSVSREDHDKPGTGAAEFKDISFVLDKELSVPARIFGEEPKPGAELYFVFDGDTEGLREIIFYVRMLSGAGRNLTVDRTEHIFADIDWEIYTVDGFEQVNVRDYTGAFVNSGEIRIQLPESELAVYDRIPVPGFCIRASLKRSDYDMVPKMTNLFGFLFEVWQKDTKAYSQTFSRTDHIAVRSPMGENVYYLVFAREAKGASYRRYELATPGTLTGRYCEYYQEAGTMNIKFNMMEFGFAPVKCKECVRVIVYSEEVMRRYSVGRVIGYDEQEISLPLDHIVADSFFLIARRKDEEGYIYDFVRPEKKLPGGLYYHLLENEGSIVIEDAGDYIGADLFMGSVATSSGKRGNIGAGSHIMIDDGTGSAFYNPGPGIGGAYKETLEEVRARFLKDMRTPYTAVTASDYETLVKTTPGLCIRKTRAVFDQSDNMVRVVVMPDNDEEFPRLSEIYKQRITKRLEERRLITSRFTIIQPVYAAVGVRCTVYVKRHFSDCRSQIEERIRTRLDYLNSDHNIGEKLRFEDVFHAIEELSCVEYVYELSLHSENAKIAQLKEYDIIPRYDCLIYPGNIQLQIVTSQE